MKRLWHPTKKRLAEWLDSGDTGLDTHVATCERCATKLEDLSEPTTALGEALRTMLAPPADLHPRLRTGIARKMQTREDLRLLVELMGLPFQTVRSLGPPDPGSSPSSPAQDQE